MPSIERRGPRGRHPDDGPGLPGPPGDAGAGLLPGRADGPLRAAGRPTCSSATPSSAAGARDHARQLRAAARRATRRSRSAAPRREVTVDGERRRRLGEPSGARRAPSSRSGSRPGPASASTSRSTAASTSRCCSAPARRTRWARSAGSTGRALQQGDRLSARRAAAEDGGGGTRFAATARPQYSRDWEVRAMRGPQAAPGLPDRGRHGDALRPRLAGRPQLQPHRHPARVAQVRVGAAERRASPAATRRTSSTTATRSARSTSTATSR